MRQPYLAVCDRENEYAKRLAEFINRKPSIPFRVGVFSEKETLKEFAQKSRIDILLMAESFMEEDVKDMPVGNIILLDEGSGERFNQIKRIYKYQSAEAILKELLLFLSESQMLLHGKNVNKQTLFYTFFSPVKRCLQTTTALHFAGVLARNQKVLFLNLEAFSTLDTLVQKEFTEDLSDLLYFSGRDIDKFAYRLSSMVVSEENIDILPPITSLEDLQAIDQSRWITFLENIKDTHSYDAVVIDMGEAVQGFIEILGRSEEIYQIEKEDPASKTAILRYHNFLELTGNLYLEDITRTLLIPELEEIRDLEPGSRNQRLNAYIENVIMAG